MNTPNIAPEQLPGTGNVLSGRTRVVVGSFITTGIVAGVGGLVYAGLEVLDESKYVPDSVQGKGAISLVAGSLLLAATLISRERKRTIVTESEY